MEAPRITGDRVVLDALHEGDADRLVECDDELIRWAWGRNQPLTRAAALDAIRKARGKWQRGSAFRRFAIRREGDPRLVGTIYLHPSHRGHVIEIWVCCDARRRGVGRAALGAGLRYAFQELDLTEIHADIKRGNDASTELVKAVGFEWVGWSQESLDSAPVGDFYRLRREAWMAGNV